MNKKYAVVVVCVAMLVMVATQAFAEYDKDMVVKAMKANGASMGVIKKAMKNGDFFTVAENLMQVAQSMKSLDAVTPKNGKKAEWDGIHGDLIKAAFKGIGACGEEDIDKLQMHIGEIGALIKEGHKIFTK